MSIRKAAIAATLLSLCLAGVALAAGPQDPSLPPGPPPPPNRGRGPDSRMLLSALTLSDAQKAQLDVIGAAERATAEPIVAQMREARRAIDDAIAAGQFDEQQIRTLASAEAQLQVELTVARARTQAAILQMLTSEQKAKLDKLRETQRRMQGFLRGFENR